MAALTAAAALAEGTTHGEAARRAGIAPRTLYRWMAKPRFQAHLAELTAHRVRRIAAAGQERAAGVLAVLADVAEGRLEAPPELLDVRVKAAGLVLRVAGAVGSPTGRPPSSPAVAVQVNATAQQPRFYSEDLPAEQRVEILTHGRSEGSGT